MNMYPFPVKHCQISPNVELAYMEAGQGATSLVFIHGLGSYAPAWNKMIPLLSDVCHCLAVDLPNYGLSKKGDYSFSMSFFADCLEAFIRKLGLKKVVLAGHSMGGQIALTMALRKNIKIKKLVLLAPAGFEQFTTSDRAWFEKFVTPTLLQSLSIEQITENFDLNFSTKKLPPDAHFMLEDRLELREKDPAGYESFCKMVARCVQGMLDTPVFDRLHEIVLPTLIFFGQEDYLIPNRFLHPSLSPLQVAESGYAQLPNSQLRMLSPCGHFVPWEGAVEVSEAMKRFL